MKPHLVARIALLFLVALLSAPRVAAFQPAPQGPAPVAPLFHAFLWGGELETPALQRLEPAVRDAIKARLAGRLAYKPILTVPPGLDRLAQEMARNQQQFEGMLATLSGRPDLGKQAAAAARDVRLSYEWEGDSSVPIREAVLAEEYLANHPNTVLAPALNLFILHRYRCAFEAATRFKDAQVQAKSAAWYRAARENVGRVQDVVVQALARDIDEAPYLYIETKLHPRTFKGARK